MLGYKPAKGGGNNHHSVLGAMTLTCVVLVRQTVCLDARQELHLTMRQQVHRRRKHVLTRQYCTCLKALSTNSPIDVSISVLGLLQGVCNVCLRMKCWRPWLTVQVHCFRQSRV